MWVGDSGGKRNKRGKKPIPNPKVFTDTSTNWSIGCTRVGVPPATPHALFLLRPRPPVRFYTVEALCRYVLFHSTPPLLFFVPHMRGALWKEHSKPGGDAKSPWTARSTPQPFELKNFSLCFPRFAPPAPKNSFRPIISVSSRPPTLLHTRSPCCTNLPSTLFPPQAPLKSLSWFGTHGLRPCKTATKMSDTIRRPVCTMPILAPSSHHGTNCPAFSCHTSCIK